LRNIVHINLSYVTCNKYSISKVSVITVSCLIHCHPLLWKQLSRELCNSLKMITIILIKFSSNNIKISAVIISNQSIVFYVVILCVFTFCLPCCDVSYDFRIKTMFGSSLPPVVLFTCFWLFAHSGVQSILCCVFCFSVFDCPFLIDLSIFSNVYFNTGLI
jgi:hypothetical protein